MQAAPPATREYIVERQANGRYTFYDVEAQEPHEFNGDVFDAARCAAIYERTQQRMPVGRLFIGHGKSVEHPVVGKVRYKHNAQQCRTYVDYFDVEPPTALELVLGRWPGRSIEYEYPSFDIIEGVALLGASRQFFDSFAPVDRFTYRNFTEDQLRQDAAQWPAAAARSANSTVPPVRWRRGRYGENETMTTTANREGAPAAAPAAPPKPAAPAPAAGGSVEERMAKLETMLQELMAWKSSQETAKAPPQPGAAQPAPHPAPPARADEDEAMKQMQNPDERGRDKEIAAIRARLDAADEQRAREAVHMQIDAAVRVGKLVDGDARKHIVNHAMRCKPDERRAAVDALLKNMRSVPLTDADEAGSVSAPTDPDKAETDKLIASLTTAGRARARELSGMFDELAAEGSKAAALGRAHFIRSNLDRTDGVHFANRSAANR